MKTVSIVEFKDLKPMTTEGDYRYELKEGEYIFKLGIDDLKVEHDYPIPKYVRITKRSDKKCSIVITCNSVTNLSISGIGGGNIIECVKITKEMEGVKSKDNNNEYIAFGISKLNVLNNSIACICNSLLATIGDKYNRGLNMFDSKVKDVTVKHDKGANIINSVISNELIVNEDKLEFIGEKTLVSHINSKSSSKFVYGKSVIICTKNNIFLNGKKYTMEELLKVYPEDTYVLLASTCGTMMRMCFDDSDNKSKVEPIVLKNNTTYFS